jgi:hypothetical protein
MTPTSPSEVKEAVRLGYLAPRIVIFFEPGPSNASRSEFKPQPFNADSLASFQNVLQSLI